MRLTLQFAIGAALLLASMPSTAQHDHSPEDIESGALLYRDACASCHGPEGNAIDGTDLSRGKFRRATTDGDLATIITEGIPNTAMPPSNLSRFEIRPIVAYLRSLSTTPPRQSGEGDAARGQALFEGKGGCLKCHSVHGKGGRLGPNLNEIGAIRRGADLERSVLDPNARVLVVNRLVKLVTRDGTAVTGRRMNEDTHYILLIDSNDRLLSLSKDSLRAFQVETVSPMPPYQDKFSSQELSDLITYLASLRGSP
jgi:putative heme-binding domain-containing protein